MKYLVCFLLGILASAIGDLIFADYDIYQTLYGSVYGAVMVVYMFHDDINPPTTDE